MITSLQVPLVGVGGTAPYTFAVVAGTNTTIQASVTGSTLTVNAGSVEPGTYTVQVQVTDQTGATQPQIITIQVLDPAKFAVLNTDVAYEPNVFPSNQTVALLVNGGTGAITWSIIPNVTTLPTAAISGSNLSFSLSSFGTWAVGVRATDALGNIASRVFNVAVTASAVISVVDGHALLEVAATEEQIGAHQFTLTVADSAASTARQTFNYTVEEELSAIDLAESQIDHFWGYGDTTSVVYPISGALSGFTIGATNPITAANGLVISVDTATDSIVVTGPPTSFGNAEVDVPIAILQGTTQVATITREFTLVSHNGPVTGLGNMTCNTRPYIVGELVGLNPERPYYNSPSIFKNSGYSVQLLSNSALPLGLSLDSTTGLIYGNVLAADVTQSTLQYVDTTGTVQGTITINWDIVASQFALIDNCSDGQLQAAFSGNFASSSVAALTSVQVHRGKVPDGLVVGISADRAHVSISGTPTVAGYFDLWLQVTNASGLVAYIHKRLVIDYIAPLTVLTDALNRLVTNTAFTQTLNAVGGVAPYTWSIASGSLPSGITLNANSGVLSGTTALTAYSQTLTIQVKDQRGVAATKSLLFAINNSLTITTPVLPVITPGQFYSIAVQAEGGQGAYTWALAAGSAALPGGFALSSSGVLSGATALTNYSANIIVQVTDSANNVATKNYMLAIGNASGLSIDTEGIGPITRGLAYQGTLSVLGTGTAPYTWTIAQGSSLPAGLTLTATAANNGATATIAGTTTAVLSNVAVKVVVTDANGNTATGFVLLNSYSSLQIFTLALPQATVGGNYSAQIGAYGVNTPLTFSLDASSNSLPAGLSLSAGGLISGTPASALTTTVTIRVTDAIGDFVTAKLGYTAVNSTLAFITTSLPSVTAGVPYAQWMEVTGGAQPYVYSLSPNSPNQLPTGLSIGTTSGYLQGTTLQAGYSKQITVRVTDYNGVVREQTYQLTVASGLKLQTGPDYSDSTSTNFLGLVAKGDVDSINPRTNRSFMVVATGVVSTQTSQLSFGLPSGYNCNVLSLSNSVAIIQLSGPFGNSPVGDNNFAFSMQDSGVSGSATFQFRVFSEQAINIVPASGALPQLTS